MGKKSTARAAAVAQYLANAADALGWASRPGLGPLAEGAGPFVETSDSWWGTSLAPKSDKTTFTVNVYYEKDNPDEVATTFEVTVREVKS